jgi:hypothetical protein
MAVKLELTVVELNVILVLLRAIALTDYKTVTNFTLIVEDLLARFVRVLSLGKRTDNSFSETDQLLLQWTEQALQLQEFL